MAYHLYKKICLVSSLCMSLALTSLLMSSQRAAAHDMMPVPEYWPTAAVVISETLFQNDYHAKDLVSAILAAKAKVFLAVSSKTSARKLSNTLAGAGLTKSELDLIKPLFLPHGSIWLRDFGPLISTSSDAAHQQLYFFDFSYKSANKADDVFPKALAKSLKAQVSSVPAFLEGGNFLSKGQVCFTSTTESLKGPIFPKNLNMPTASQMTQLGCHELIVLDGAPHDHLDMWLKIISDETALVSQIDEHTLRSVRKIYGYIPEPIEDLRRSLDHQALRLARHFKKIERLPLPMPYRGAFRSYANALLVNDIAIVPSYQRFGWNYDSYPDAENHKQHEQKVAEIYQRLGFTVRFVNADALIFNGGAFHCVALQIPRINQQLGRKERNSLGRALQPL